MPEGHLCHSARGYTTEEDCRRRIELIKASAEAEIVPISFTPVRPDLPIDN